MELKMFPYLLLKRNRKFGNKIEIPYRGNFRRVQIFELFEMETLFEILNIWKIKNLMDVDNHALISSLQNDSFSLLQAW